MNTDNITRRVKPRDPSARLLKRNRERIAQGLPPLGAPPIRVRKGKRNATHHPATILKRPPRGAPPVPSPPGVVGPVALVGSFQSKHPGRITMTIEVFFLFETDKAILINNDGGEEGVWLPKSQLVKWSRDATPSRGDKIMLDAPEWLLKRVFLYQASVKK
jgi:hypothetical protein